MPDRIITEITKLVRASIEVRLARDIQRILEKNGIEAGWNVVPVSAKQETVK